jgi:lysophospholipase L1-like esterase
MAKIKIDPPDSDGSGRWYGHAAFVCIFAFVLNLGLSAPVWANDCPKSPQVFTANGGWAAADLGGRTLDLKILAIGSSSTQGIGASQPTHSYPADLEALLASRFPSRSIEVVNAGIGGETAIQTVARLETALAKDSYNLVIWQVGTNDAVDDVDPDGFRAILERGISATRQARIPLILVDPQYYPSASHPRVYANFVGIVDDIGKERGVPVFSRYALMRAWNGEADGLLAAMMAKDSFHMSDRGYACWASLLADEIARRIPTVVATTRGKGAKIIVPVDAKRPSHTPVPTP